MPHAPHHPTAMALDAPAAADVLTELVGALADVLRLKPERIDPEQTFRSLGLDSLLTVEYVATVNARYGIKIKADALFDHPTLLAFARHVSRERGLPGPVGPEPAPEREPQPEPVRAAARPAPSAPRMPSAPMGASAAFAERAVLDVLREELARILCCDPWDIDTAESFNLLGVDSILGAEFIAVINRTYGLHERAVTLYDHPSLTAMAAHIASLAPVSAPPTAVAALVAPVVGIEELLDAVRDDRLSVDEALDALARRS